MSALSNKGIDVRIARYHNIFGEEGSWNDGREKSPAAICRKVAVANKGDSIDIWGDGEQTRSFLHVSECIVATLRLMRSDQHGPVNIRSDEMVSTCVRPLSSSGMVTPPPASAEDPGAVRWRGGDRVAPARAVPPRLPPFPRRSPTPHRRSGSPGSSRPTPAWP